MNPTGNRNSLRSIDGVTNRWCVMNWQRVDTLFSFRTTLYRQDELLLIQHLRNRNTSSAAHL